MHPRLQEIADFNAKIRAELTALVESTPAEKFAGRETPDGWNGHQIVHHLGHVEGAAVKMLEGACAKLLDEGAMPLDANSDSVIAWMRDRQFLDRKATPISAPERLRPPAEADVTVAWPLLQGARERTLRLMTSMDGRDLTRVTWPHPIFGPLNGYEWIGFLGGHESRHLEQLKGALANG